MKTLRHDWAFWAFLGLLVATFAFCALTAWEVNQIYHDMRKVKGQNEWSIEDRASLHSSQAQTQASLRRLEDFVDRVRQAEAARQRARQEGAQK